MIGKRIMNESGIRLFKDLYLQILFVLFAFILMIVSTYFFARNIEHRHFEEQIEYTFFTIESLLEADLKEFETMIGMTSETIREMFVRGFELDMVKSYMVDITNYNNDIKNSAGFFGFFAGFGEDGLNGFNALYPDADWDEIIASGYNPKARPWYIAAETSGSKIVITEPYTDEITNKVTFTYVRNIFDDNGKRLAIIGLDVLLDRIYKFSMENRSSEFSFWTLHDKNHIIIAHPNADFLGKPFGDVDSGFAVFADELEQEGFIANRFAFNYLGRPSYLTMRQLDNGWYLGIVASTDTYYSNISVIFWFLIVLGLLLAAGLIIILVRINAAREKSEKLASEAVENKKVLAHLEKILNGVNALICVTDPVTDEIIFINESMKKVFCVQTDCVGLKCYKELRKFDARCCFCPCNKLAIEPEKEIIWEVKDMYSNRIFLNYSKFLKWLDGRNVHIQYSVDISAQKEAEREVVKKSELLEIALANAESANVAKSRFLAKMSHEIRTPMNAIIGMTELALRETGIETKDEHIRTVKQAASNLLAIINDILDFSKIEAGKMEIIPDEYSLPSLLNDLISIIRMRVIDSQLRFAVKVDSKVPQTLFGDETKIRQAVLNILNNAVKYTESGYVSFGVSAEYINDKKLNLIFKVTDTGIGIKPEDMDKLFADFSQLDPETSRSIEGVGLGLAIAKTIVTAMDGGITVNSEYGKGSTFTVTLPQMYRSRETIAKVEQPQKKSAVIFERRDIYAESLKWTIENLSVQCTVISSRAELEEKITVRENFDYLFISYVLFSKIEDIALKYAGKIKIVILADFGETVTAGNIKTLSMPVYCSQIADIFNETISSRQYEANSEWTAGFYAPDARVLIVDDINTNLKVAQGLMTPYNMKVDICNSGKAAIEAVQNERYDLVFMDHKMPGMDGIEATRIIRERESGLSPPCSPVPVIALTANAVSGMAEMFFKNGFNDFLSKPIDTIKLNEILEKWIPKDKQKRK